MSRWMGALKANGLRRLNQISERKYGRVRLYRTVDSRHEVKKVEDRVKRWIVHVGAWSRKLIVVCPIFINF
ncbi:hypothetical protein HanXRQr2_Chr09g0396021 [Helianthus annuus]|uniref:Uncharacterized protein n=1 Tax=Helianthus annuus TaxID=4232 RepID=A0A251TV22_HELAN|nr:hypothetical protein HanXRQr2_Chr09g0396021 [Helianthus annuus]